ncbi:MAG: transglutaminase-like domain-containing protein [Planctomycetota bacterium]
MRHAISVLVLLAAMFLPGVAAAQERRSDVITRSEPLDWRLKTAITLGSRVDQPIEAFAVCPHDPASGTTVRIGDQAEPRGDGIVGRVDVDEATVYFPFAARSASYEVDHESVTAEILHNGQPIPLRGSLQRTDVSGLPLHSGAAYGVWSFGPARNFAPSVILQFEFEATAWNITLNENVARSIPWPTGDWPAEAASSLEPMLFIDSGFDSAYDPEPIRQIIEEWTAGKPRSQPPMVTAKWIAGQLSNAFQSVGMLTSQDSIAANEVQPGRSIGAMQGLNATRLDVAAATMVGTPMDMPLLLTALYREAGLPARIVVGYVAGDEGGRRDPVRRRDEPELGVYAWVEFALYDESAPALAEALTWVPVDILSMRAGNVGRRPLDQTWDGFGRGEYFNELIPLAYHLHPHRLPAVSYGVGDANARLRRYRDSLPTRTPAPSLWGWNIAPETPSRIYQTIVFSPTTPSKTAEDARREPSGRAR